MRILETIVVIVMLTALGILLLFGIGFFLLKLELPSKKINKMGKMEDFFKNNKKVIKDVDYFFAEQWKPYFIFLIRTGIIFSIFSTLVLLFWGITAYWGIGGEKEEGIYVFKFTGIFLLVIYLSMAIFLVSSKKFKDMFPKAKQDFQRQYPSYTNQRLNSEIVKYDNDRIELGASFFQNAIIWFCSDFLMYGQMNGYIFIRYKDIEYILVRKPGHTSYRSITPDLYYTFYIYYRIKGEEKKFTFLALSNYPLVWEFKKRNVEVSEVSDD